MSRHLAHSRTAAALFGLLSVVVAGGTAFTAYLLASGYAPSATTTAPVISVVVATRDLDVGQVIGLDHVRLVSRPAGAVASNAFATVEAVVGETVSASILMDEALRPERLATGDSRLWLNDVLQEGMRAVTLKVERQAAVGGLLEPGFHVDVIVTIRPDDNALTAKWVTKNILQGVRVLAVDSDMTAGVAKDEAKRAQNARQVYVTLEVEPEEAAQLALATARGQLHLALRAPGDFAFIENAEPLVTNALVGLPAPVAAAQARRLRRRRDPIPHKPDSVQVIRGDQAVTEYFDGTGSPVASTPHASGWR